MRHVPRPALPQQVISYLKSKRAVATQRWRTQTLDIEALWKQSRQTRKIQQALKLLQQAMGPRERGMYCLDSHGLDAREALAAGYRRTFRKLAGIVAEALDNLPITAEERLDRLRDEDDHDLLT